MVLNVLRVAPAPLTVREIAVTVIEHQGLDPDDSRPFQLMSKLVNNALIGVDAHRVAFPRLTGTPATSITWPSARSGGSMTS